MEILRAVTRQRKEIMGWAIKGQMMAIHRGTSYKRLLDKTIETIFLEKTILVVHGARFLVYTIHNVLHI